MSERYGNLPTPQRMAINGHITVIANRAKVDHPLRVDKLFNNGVIDETEHTTCMALYRMWTHATAHNLKHQKWEQRIQFSCPPPIELAACNRLDAEAMFLHVMNAMRAREREFVRLVVIEEMPVIDAGKTLKIGINGCAAHFHYAIEELQKAIDGMNERRKSLAQSPTSP